MMLATPDQHKAPIFEALCSYRVVGAALLHMPGHRGGAGFEAAELAAVGSLDFTEVPGLDDLHSPDGPIAEALELLARAFGAGHSYFLVNGASSGIHALLLTVSQQGRPVLVPRYAHRSFWSGLVMSGARPVYYPGRIVPDLGIVVGLDLEALEQRLEENPQATAVFATSPTFFGTCSDLRAVARVAGRYGKMVMVDEAHGAHFRFHPALPEPALQQGCAAAVQGLHKTLPVLTQGAALHVAAGAFPGTRLQRAYSAVTTTSPSYPLLASMDLARRLMVLRGEALRAEALRRAQWCRERLRRLPGVSCPQEELAQVTGVTGVDPLKVVIAVEGLEIDGLQVARLLRERWGVQVEMAQPGFVLAMFSLCHQPEDWRRLVAGMEEISRQYAGGARRRRRPLQALPPEGEVVMTPREAFFADRVAVPWQEAAGAIAAEAIAPYPPGIPCILPGERVSREALEYVREAARMGWRIQGATDASLRTLEVIR
jgi:lysine decarboxylase